MGLACILLAHPNCEMGGVADMWCVGVMAVVLWFSRVTRIDALAVSSRVTGCMLVGAVWLPS